MDENHADEELQGNLVNKRKQKNEWMNEWMKASIEYTNNYLL